MHERGLGWKYVAVLHFILFYAFISPNPAWTAGLEQPERFRGYLDSIASVMSRYDPDMLDQADCLELVDALMHLGAASKESKHLSTLTGMLPKGLGSRNKAVRRCMDILAGMYRQDMAIFLRKAGRSSRGPLKSLYTMALSRGGSPLLSSAKASQASSSLPIQGDDPAARYAQAYLANAAALDSFPPSPTCRENKSQLNAKLDAYDLFRTVAFYQALELILDRVSESGHGEESTGSAKNILDTVSLELPDIWRVTVTFDKLAAETADPKVRKASQALADAAWEVHVRLADRLLQAAKATGTPTGKFDIFPRR